MSELNEKTIAEDTALDLIEEHLRALVGALAMIEEHLHAMVILLAEDNVGPVRTESRKILDSYAER